MFEASLYSYLTSHPGLSALVGSRIYPLRLPDAATLPAIVYQRVSAVREATFDGRIDLVDSRFQFDIWAETYAVAKAVAEQLKAALIGFSGTMGTVRVSVPSQERELDLFEQDTGHYRVSADYHVWHQDDS